MPEPAHPSRAPLDDLSCDALAQARAWWRAGPQDDDLVDWSLIERLGTTHRGAAVTEPAHAAR